VTKDPEAGRPPFVLIWFAAPYVAVCVPVALTAWLRLSPPGMVDIAVAASAAMCVSSVAWAMARCRRTRGRQLRALVVPLAAALLGSAAGYLPGVRLADWIAARSASSGT